MNFNKLPFALSSIFIVIIFTTTVFAQDEQYQVSIKRFQASRSRLFKTEKESPLKKKYLKDFGSLSYFDVNQAYRVTARFIPAADQTPFEMPTFYNNRSIKHIKRGTLQFTLNGKEYTLSVYQRAPQLDGKEKVASSYAFVPFRDMTNGSDTYEGGRYIDLAKTVPETITLDFNLAYTPDCAYNNHFICPVPPDENRLDTRVEAGEKIYTEAIDTKAKK
ncbi:MAG: DUF1684 domain-containing protein [Pyrinomonadaceae bacterium]